MANEISAWNKILTSAMSLPGVKVNRATFLEEQFKTYYTPEQIAPIIENGPIGIIPMSILDKIASDCISYHTNIASGTSFVAGLPGGLAMIGTIPADVAQFYFHVFVIAQKRCGRRPKGAARSGRADSETLAAATLAICAHTVGHLSASDTNSPYAGHSSHQDFLQSRCSESGAGHWRYRLRRTHLCHLSYSSQTPEESTPNIHALSL